MNMIVGKKQIILGALVIGLGAAVYLNWQFSQGDNNLTTTNALDTSNKTYGDAKLVDTPLNNEDNEAYFAEAKMTRQKARDEAAESLKNMLSEADLSTDMKAEMTMKATDIAKSIETESKIENLIKAKGVTDCMVYFDTKRVDVVVKTPELSEEDAVIMKDIIIKETNIPVENISIVEIN